MVAVTIPKILVVGLGNLPFPYTRHSIGQFIVDSLASRLGIHMSSERNGISGQGNVLVGETLVSLTLFKSKSLMNISGPSIAATMRKTIQSPTSMIVISDSLSHKVETLQVRLGGSANGHNGLKSIISSLGNDMNFYRFRVGIGRDETDAAMYVMRKLSSHEQQFWNDRGLDLVLAEIEKVARKRQ
ncbi:putative peptidyl-tRNA hydrolase [Hypsizygus marmoreus]|uniref:peptidyl-tRNA hydrolase n=1 Tax=Hypsizygus marmoreus TaxID=39966 RepID=A0A369JCU0_HYPMA|nr:putative peptidyl-tRNA hydrolase [Hypsizygus marmoreus]